MRSISSFFVLLAVALVGAACGGTGSATQVPGVTQGPTPNQPVTGTQAPGGGGPNGSITYTMSGDMTASGELPFVPVLSLFDPTTNGWTATFALDSGFTAITLNTQAAGQIFNFSSPDGSVVGTSDPGSGTGCTFTLTKNDAAGVAGTMVCTSAQVVAGPGAGPQKHAVVNAQWNAHP